MTNNMHNNNFDTPARVPLVPIIDNTPARIPLKSFNNSISNYIIYNTIEEAVMSIKYEEFYKDELFAFIVHSPITPNVMYHRYLISNYGRVYDLCNKRFLAASFTTKVRGYLGYKRIKLALYINPYNIIHKDCYIHRLVAYYFLYFPSCELLEVNHKNGDHSNNVWTNIEWVTGEYNRYHAKVNNIIPRGEQKNNALITDKQAEIICQYIINGLSNLQISEITGISTSVISTIRYGQCYSHISMKYGVTNYINHKSDLLTDLQVHEVCRYLLEGFTMKEVAEKVGCNEQQVKDIRYAGNYSHISSFYRLEDIPERKRWNRIEDNKVVKICKMIESKKYSCAEIARILNVSNSTVLGIKNNELYVDISKDYIMPGKSNRLNSFNEEDAERVCKELIKKDNRTIKELARDTDTTEYFVSDIKRCRIKRFKEITDKYNIKNNK